MPFAFPDGFIRRMSTLLQEEWPDFVAGYDRPARRGLRINPLKASPARLIDQLPLQLIPSPFVPPAHYGYLLEAAGESWRAGTDPFHHAGAYYMQEPSAMAVVPILDPRPGETILDLCAAPGGKSTQIAAALQGRGLLWSNEYVRSRAQVLAQNLERCGVSNGVISSCDPAVLADRLPGCFEGVLVDAPCSGEGMFRKEPEALAQWSEDNIRLCAARQRTILEAAASLVAPGGRLVYSTCTFAPEENEGMMVWFLSTHPEFSLEPIDVSWGRPGFSWERIRPFVPDLDGSGRPLERCRRILPQHGGEGHFVARLHRAGDPAAKPPIPPHIYEPPGPYSPAAADLLADCLLCPPEGSPAVFGSWIRLLPPGLPAMNGLGVLGAGVTAAEICKNRLEPAHALFMSTRSENCRRCLSLSLEDPRLTAFLRGEEIPAPGENGWTAVAVEGVVTGFGKVSGGRLKNRYPKGLRLKG